MCFEYKGLIDRSIILRFMCESRFMCKLITKNLEIAYQQQQNTLYPKRAKFCNNNFLKLLIGSQPIIERL